MKNDFIAETDPILCANNSLVAEPIDASGDLSLQQLVTNINENLESRKPSSRLFLFMGRRQIEKQELDIQHQQNILKQIELLGLTADERARTKAKFFLAGDTVQAIVDNRMEDIKWERAEFVKRMRLADKQHFDTLQTVDDRAEQRGLILDREKAEIRRILAETALTDLQGKLLEKIIRELDVNSITAEQAFVLVKSMNTNANANVDFIAQEAMLDAKVNQMKAETSKKTAEARREFIQADADDLTLQQTRKKYD